MRLEVPERNRQKELVGVWDTHIQGHGSLGGVYPKYKYGVEGDTPAFLHLLPIGLNDPNEPTQGGWGGYFAWGKGEDDETSCFTNCRDPEYSICRKLEDHFYPATFNNFAARMDWAKDGKGNRNPVVIIEGDASLSILTKKPELGTTVTLDASASSDPDGDQLGFHWWVLSAAGTYDKPLEIASGDSDKATIRIPPDSAGKTFLSVSA